MLIIKERKKKFQALYQIKRGENGNPCFIHNFMEMLSGCFLFAIVLLYIIFINLRYDKFIPKVSTAVFMKASRTLPRNCFALT